MSRAASGRAILGRVMLAFEGERLPPRITERLAAAPAAGLTLFRGHNVRSAGQVRALTEAFQRAGAAGAGGVAASPMLVAADQEGGQFLALGDDATPFAGNMALGAADDEVLTWAVAAAIGREARAMGVNVVYAPVLDLATNPANPALGIRAFGDDPAAVSRHGLAFVRGLQTAGVAAAVKHAPGSGHAATDTHLGLPSVDADRATLDAREFAPFRSAFAADGDDAPWLAMSGHLALPAITGRRDLPATLSRAVMTDLLREHLGFRGVTISDALDMGALAQGRDGAPDVVAAVRAGVDLLLAAADPEALARIEDALERGLARDLFDLDELRATDARVAELRAWLRRQASAPDLAVVGCAAHRELATTLAARSVTLVRDPAGLVPTALGPERGRVLAVMPRPVDLTPADTSSTVRPALAAALRRYHPDVDEIITDQSPDPAAIAAVRDRAADAGLAVIGTIDGHRQEAQMALVAAVAATGTPTVMVAMRGPWDVGLAAASVTTLATYGILPGSLEALAAVLAGASAATGRLPVRIGWVR